MTDHFLQSKEWEEFQKSLGREVFRVDGVLFITLPLVLGKNYLYCAGASAERSLQKLFANFAKQKNAVFLKFEPLTEDSASQDNLLQSGFVKSKKEIQPQRTIVLDLRASEEQLLGAMHGKTRYNIGVAERHGARVMKHATCPPTGGPPKGDNMKHTEAFWRLVQKTAKRDHFFSHTREYYEKLLVSPLVNLFTIEYQNKIIAANVVLFYGGRAIYLHGASDYEYRNLMAPYLLHWETIKHAKAYGFKEYDFWGIDEKKWPGLTRFKRGFKGRKVEYIGSYDYVLQPMWYALYRLRNFLKVKF